MVTKYRYIVIILLYLSSAVNGQSGLDFQMVDTTTYQYYKSGDWDNLIIVGNKAIKEGIDYKYLRQRIGYAYYVKGDYLRSVRDFEKALRYDSYDSFTLAYLYYANLNLLRTETAGYYSSRIPVENRNSYQVGTSKLVESIDFEVNLKVPSATLRSDPLFFRIGSGSRPWQRIGLYQSVSAFNQFMTVRYPTQDIDVRSRQFEYYGIVRYALLPHWILKTGYHFLYTDYSSSVTYTNLGYLGVSADFDILNVRIDGSVMKNIHISAKQAGLKAGLIIPGTMNLNFTSGVTLLNQQNSTGLIYSQRVGFRLSKNIWMEGDITSGYLNYYNDFDAMYVYNSLDPITFRTGLTSYFTGRKNITFLINMGFERKEYYESDQYHYNQFSITGGIKWRP